MFSMVKITEDILKRMVEFRKKGYSYNMISEAVGVSKWACIKYLRGVKVPESAVVNNWRQAELEARDWLKQHGFFRIHDLNEICASPYWDYLATKGNENWLVDVTVSGSKNIGAKIPFVVQGYTCAILHKNIHTNKFRFIKVTLEEETLRPAKNRFLV